MMGRRDQTVEHTYDLQIITRLIKSLLVYHNIYFNMSLITEDQAKN